MKLKIFTIIILHDKILKVSEKLSKFNFSGILIQY